MQRTLLALALIMTAGTSYAQTMPGNEPRDPYGHPFIGRNDWVAQPGDRTNAGAARRMNYATPEMAQAPQTMPMERHQGAFKDEYGRLYDAQGNRVDSRGNIIPVHAR